MHKDGRKNDRKMIHEVMKAKGINVSETKFGKTLSEINPERKKENPKKEAECCRSLVKSKGLQC